MECPKCKKQLATNYFCFSILTPSVTEKLQVNAMMQLTAVTVVY